MFYIFNKARLSDEEDNITRNNSNLTLKKKIDLNRTAEKKNEMLDIINIMRKLIRIGIDNSIYFINDENINKHHIENKDLFDLTKIKKIDTFSQEVENLELKLRNYKIYQNDIIQCESKTQINLNYINLCSKKFTEIFKLCFDNNMDSTMIDDSINDDIDPTDDVSNKIPSSFVKKIGLYEKNKNQFALEKMPTKVKIHTENNPVLLKVLSEAKKEREKFKNEVYIQAIKQVDSNEVKFIISDSDSDL